MRDFLLTVVAALVVAGIGFGAAAFTLGRADGLAPTPPDGKPFDLPAGRALSADDVRTLRFDTTLRGYRMSQVDEVLARVAHDLEQIAAYVEALEAQAHQFGSRPPTPPTAVPSAATSPAATPPAPGPAPVVPPAPEPPAAAATDRATDGAEVADRSATQPVTSWPAPWTG